MQGKSYKNQQYSDTSQTKGQYSHKRVKNIKMRVQTSPSRN